MHTPICRKDGDLETALYGSFLPIPKLEVFDKPLRQDDESEQVTNRARLFQTEDVIFSNILYLYNIRKRTHGQY